MTLTVEGLPAIDHGATIRSKALGLTKAAGAIVTHSEGVQRSWSALGAVYHAPEQDLVLKAMDNPVKEARDLRTNTTAISKALNTYAGRCDALRAERAALVTAINTFHDDKYPVSHTENDVELVRREERLLGRCSALQSAIDEAQNECATAINAIWHGPKVSQAGKAQPGDDVYGYTKEAYDEAARVGRKPDGEPVPWGVPEGWKGEGLLSAGYMIGRGAGTAIGGMLSTGFTLMGGRGPGEQLSTALFMGIGTFNLTRDVFYASPVGWQLDPDRSVQAQMRLYLQGKYVVDSARTRPYDFAGGMLPDLALTLATGGTGTAAKTTLRASVLSAALQAPRAAATAKHLAAAGRVLHPGPKLATIGVPNEGGGASHVAKHSTPDMGTMHNKADSGSSHSTTSSAGSGSGHGPEHGTSKPEAKQPDAHHAPDSSHDSPELERNREPDAKPDGTPEPPLNEPDPHHDGSTQSPEAEADHPGPDYDIPDPPNGEPHRKWPDFPFKPLGNDRFESPGGVIYDPAPGISDNHRVYHVLQHGFPNPAKRAHSVFVDRDNIMSLIDRAWSKHGPPDPNDEAMYIVDMGDEIVGTDDETRVLIIMRPGTSRIITAYPIK